VFLAWLRLILLSNHQTRVSRSDWARMAQEWVPAVFAFDSRSSNRCFKHFDDSFKAL
jgi:hypothetical protein